MVTVAGFRKTTSRAKLIMSSGQHMKSLTLMADAADGLKLWKITQ
jgi:hypothetical protein